MKTATAAAAIGGATAVVPMATSSGSALASRSKSAMRLADESVLDQPVIAHLKDLRTGEVTLYVGENEVQVHDRHVAALLYAASREGR
ncbi:MAG: hypothetical protein JWM85_1183 [Acidimicrobiaceae bacterium]|nr:hypothetical protein [Acidimicrobiaceae bacterium]